ncbi:MAG: antibiotic biosynthesis monooxygenase [Desulfocapsaceae bacterium]|nr:antibiotic biosynthesis monooxygenase [Desulfocapsaceae bacterium]
MTVKIFIKRDVQDKNFAELTALLKSLRALTLNQPGYISGETLQRIDKTNESMVISTWRSVGDWNNWVNNPRRLELQTKIDQLLGTETDYAVYE